MNAYLLYGVAVRTDRDMPWHRLADATDVPTLSLEFHSGEEPVETSDLLSFEEIEIGWSISAGPIRATVNRETREVVVTSPNEGLVARTERAVIPVASELLFDRSVAYFHASAVAKNGKVLAFFGESGAGKSSTGWALHGAGWDHVTDDMLAIGSDLSVYPSGTPARLRRPTRADETLGERDPSTGKFHHRPRRWVRGPLELGAIAVLQPSKGALNVTPLKGATAFAALAAAPLRFSDEAEHMKTVFSRISKIAGEVPIYRVEIPHYESKMPEHADALEAALQDLGWEQ